MSLKNIKVKDFVTITWCTPQVNNLHAYLVIYIDYSTIILLDHRERFNIRCYDSLLKSFELNGKCAQDFHCFGLGLSGVGHVVSSTCPTTRAAKLYLQEKGIIKC